MKKLYVLVFLVLYASGPAFCEEPENSADRYLTPAAFASGNYLDQGSSLGPYTK